MNRRDANLNRKGAKTQREAKLCNWMERLGAHIGGGFE
jgi:hypothetical protein